MTTTTTEKTTTALALVPSAAAAADELREREDNFRQHHAAMTDAFSDGFIAARACGVELNQIRTKSLWKSVAGTWTEYTQRLGITDRWARIVSRLATDIDLKTVEGKKLSISEWSEIVQACSTLTDPPVRAKAISSASARLYEEKIARQNEKNGEAKGEKKAKEKAPSPEQKRARARAVAEEEVAKSGGKTKPKKAAAKSTRRAAPAPDEAPVEIKLVVLGPGELPESFSVPLENPKSGAVWQRAPKAANGSQFRIVVGKQLVVGRIGDDRVEFMIAPRK